MTMAQETWELVKKILKHKSVSLFWLQLSIDYNEFCDMCGYDTRLTNEEYKLLKEVLK